MTKPPLTIDNAKVLRVADLGDAIPTGRTRHIVQGHPATGIVALAITRYDPSEGVYLFYCDANWHAVTDTYHDDIKAAIAQAEFEFGPLEFVSPPVTADP